MKWVELMKWFELTWNKAVPVVLCCAIGVVIMVLIVTPFLDGFDDCIVKEK